MVRLEKPYAGRRALKALAVICVALTMTVPSLAGSVTEAADAWDRGDYVGAMRVYRALADRGNPEAQHKIGTMYQNGWGVPQNYGQAVKWFESAANGGNPDAQKSLGFMFLYGRGVQQDRVTAQMWFIVASSAGNGSAAFAANLAAAEMSPEQVAEASDRARQWQTMGPPSSRDVGR
jgi:uncharacterized protein